MYEWKNIMTAPTTGRIDIWAKRWIAKEDEFEFKRFPDCFWRSTHFSGMPKEWCPTHWLPAPAPPADDVDVNALEGTAHALP